MYIFLLHNIPFFIAINYSQLLSFIEFRDSVSCSMCHYVSLVHIYNLYHLTQNLKYSVIKTNIKIFYYILVTIIGSIF